MVNNGDGCNSSSSGGGGGSSSSAGGTSLSAEELKAKFVCEVSERESTASESLSALIRLQINAPINFHRWLSYEGEKRRKQHQRDNERPTWSTGLMG